MATDDFSKSPAKHNPSAKIVDPNASDASRTSKGMPASQDLPGHRAWDSMHGVGADAQGITSRQQTRDLDNRVANCQVLIQNGNCNSGEEFWYPSAGDWYNWPGIGGTASNRTGGTIMSNSAPANPSGYDFVGGQTTSNTDLSTPALIKGSYSTTTNNEKMHYRQRSVNNCNCGTGGAGTATYNCYSNCNCNCACVCVCVCACDCSCFMPDTLVTLEDGTIKAIADIEVGDRVRGAFDVVNEVRAVNKITLGRGRMYLINDDFIIHGSHRFWDRSKGFVCVEPEVYMAAVEEYYDEGHVKFIDDNMPKGLFDCVDSWEEYKPCPSELYPSRIEVGTKLAGGWGDSQRDIEVVSVTQLDMPEDTSIIELGLNNGSGMYQVFRHNLWAVGVVDYDFPFADKIER